jgi:hypothetical protein
MRGRCAGLLAVWMAAASPAEHQPPEVLLREPRLGVLVTDAGDVRPIRGGLGAAEIGSPLWPAGELSMLAVAPAGDWAVGRAAAGLTLLRLEGGRMEGSPLPVGHAVTAAVMNPSASHALLFDRDTGRASVYGFAEGRVIRTAGLGFWGQLTQAALDDAGTTVVFVTGHGAGSPAVGWWRAGQTPRLLGRLGAVSDLQFPEAGGDAIAADSLSRRLYRIRSAGGFEPIGPALNRLAGALRVAVAGRGGRIFAVGTESKHVAMVETASGALEYLECDCVTEGLSPLAGESLFALTSRTDQPLWLLDGAKGGQLLFVPPAVASELPAMPAGEGAGLGSEAANEPAIAIDLPRFLSTGEQLRLTARLQSPAARTLHGQLQLELEADSGIVQSGGRLLFSTGTRVAAFRVEEGEQELRFPVGSLHLQTGMTNGVVKVIPLVFGADGEKWRLEATGAVVRTAGVNDLSVRIRVRSSGKDATVYELIYSGITRAQAGAPRTITFSLTESGPGALEVRCPSCQSNGRTIMLTSLFSSLASGARFELIVPVTVQGSLSKLKRAETVFLEGEASTRCTVEAPWGRTWTCQ